MKDFRSLKVWKKSHQLTLNIYDLTKSFPNEELYGLTSQLRRSASSIAVNIAEACGRGSDADFTRFLYIALGSASETEYLLLLSNDLSYIKPQEYGKLSEQIEEVKKMLASLINKIKNE